MFRNLVLLSLIYAEICFCPTNYDSLSSDYWVSSDQIVFCSPEQCDFRLTTTFSTTTTSKLTTTCEAIPVIYSSTEIISELKPEVCSYFISFG